MSDWQQRAVDAELRAQDLERKLTKLTLLIKENQAKGLLGMSPRQKQLQAAIDQQQAQIDELERYLATLTDLLERQSAQLAASKKFCKNIGLSTDLQTSFKIEIQAMNQAKSFVAEDNLGDVNPHPELQKCIDYLYQFVLEVNVFSKKGDSAQEEALVTQIEKGGSIDVSNIANPHIVANTLLLYFRRQPQAYIPNKNDFLRVMKEQPSDQMRAFELHKLINKLPLQKKNQLKELFGLLSEIGKEFETNRMTADRVAEIWGPILFQSDSSTMRATECMILNDTFVFEKERKNRVFREGRDHTGGASAWKQYDESMYSRGNIGNKGAFAGHAGV